MMVHRQPAIGALQRLLVHVPADAEYFVIISFGHRFLRLRRRGGRFYGYLNHGRPQKLTFEIVPPAELVENGVVGASAASSRITAWCRLGSNSCR